MSGNCGTCKHWEGVQFTEYHRCALGSTDGGVPVVGAQDPPRQALAWALDCSAYGADMVTVEEFGCVQWEAK